MSSEPSTLPVDDVSLHLESDLPSLASRAAIELDNLVLGRATGIGALAHLANVISECLGTSNGQRTPTPLFDPSTAVVINLAITDSQLVEKRITTVEELLSHAGSLRVNLEKLASDPRSFAEHQRDLLAKMRSFCLALSRRAAARRPSIHDWEHSQPFRR